MAMAKPERGDWIERYEADGHVTVPGVFTGARMDEAAADLVAWGEEFLAGLTPEQRAWYVDGGVQSATVLRKLDNPHRQRAVFRGLATDPVLVARVEALIGPGVSVYFSQVFMKPARGGGPKPVHQDNYYFGPSDLDGVVTAWVAIDAATTENGCLFFGDGTQRGPVHPHVAPPERPYDLQVPEAIAAAQPMTPAPVPRGGVSFHHGTVFHQSSDNRSDRPRRACAFHYVRNDVDFVTPALPYDRTMVMRVTG